MSAKIIHYRNNCIGCNSCLEHCKTLWKMNDDGQMDLVGATKKNNNIYVLEIDDTLVEANKKAAKDCPVNIIKIID